MIMGHSEYSVHLLVHGFWVGGTVSVFLFPSLPPRFHLSLQRQQICQNICGCYGDGYKERTDEGGNFLNKEIIPETGC